MILVFQEERIIPGFIGPWDTSIMRSIIKGDNFTAIRSRLDVDFDITDWLNVGTNTQFTVRDESAVAANIGWMQSVSPFAKLRNDDGTLKWYPGDYVGGTNPLDQYFGAGQGS